MAEIFQNIDDYIATFPEKVQERLQLVRATIRKIVPDATETISYGIPTLVLKKNLIHFAGFKNHIGLYALPSANQEFESELQKYKTGKGSIQFPLNEELPIELIEKLVEFRVKELMQKK
jgi:uncharacterized protein YdhG (YjbR/CyaY superfamily)